MTLHTTNDSVVVSFMHHGVRSFAEPGDPISVEFPDGKGVSGTLAGVDIDAGGTPFRLVVTHDGQWPDARPETLADGANGADRGDTPTSRPDDDTELLKAENTRLRMELELSRERADDYRSRMNLRGNRLAGAIDALSDTRQEVLRLKEELARRDIADRVVSEETTATGYSINRGEGTWLPGVEVQDTPPPMVTYVVNVQAGTPLTIDTRG